MISEPVDHIEVRAKKWIDHIGEGEMMEGQSTIGGGSLPGETLPTWLVALQVQSPNRMLTNLRQASPAIIARLEEDRLVLDPRTVLAEQEGQLLENLVEILSQKK